MTSDHFRQRGRGTPGDSGRATDRRNSLRVRSRGGLARGGTRPARPREGRFPTDHRAVRATDRRDATRSPLATTRRDRPALGVILTPATRADAAERWAADMEGWLREGMNGNDFRVLSHSGTLLMRACLAIADLAERLWERAAELGAATDEVTAAREAVAAARGRMLATRPRI